MISEPTIREIRDEDIGQVIDIWHASGVTRPWNDPAADLTFARRGPHSTVLVAELDKRVAATVMVGEDGHRGWAYYVSVLPERQGTGLGRAIMSAAETWLAKRGVWKLNLLVREGNLPVERFYEHLGYRDTRAICYQKIIQPLPGSQGKAEP